MIRLTIPAHDMEKLEPERFSASLSPDPTEIGSGISDGDGTVMPRSGGGPYM